MKMSITYKRLEPDTENGERLEMITRYSSFDKKEIDKMEQKAKAAVGSGVTLEFPYKDGESDE